MRRRLKSTDQHLAIGLVMLAALLSLVARPALADEPASLATSRNWVTALAFSPDGNTLATVGGQTLLYRPGEAKLWDVATGKEKAKLDGHQSTVWAVAFSPTARPWPPVATTACLSSGTWKAVRKRPRCSHTSIGSRCLVFSPDGKLLATAGEDMTAKLLDPNTGAEIKALAGHSGSVTGIAFSPDSATVATSSGDKTAQLWDVAAGTSKAKLEGHADGVTSVAFSPDGKTLATGSTDRTVKLWDVATAKEAATLAGHKNWVTSVRFSPDGKVLASGSHDHSTKLWNVDSRQEMGTLGGLEGTVWSVAFAPNGQTLAVGGQGEGAATW